MAPKERACAKCDGTFSIAPDDFAFYKKLDVPPPTWCPPCRDIRRLAWREEHTLYRGICGLCGTSTISIHAPGGPFTVYCRACYKSDKWEPLAYGRDYDFGTPFFSQYRALMESVPRPALTGHNIVNSDYSHASFNCKNCYFVFWSYRAENCQYSYGLLLSRDTYDAYGTDNSDRVYESIFSDRLYRANFCFFSDECFDSSFMYDCVGCSDCFGCINMRKKKYCLFNEQMSKNDYIKKRAYWDLGSYRRLEEAKEKFRKLYLATPRRFARITSAANVLGDNIRETKNCQFCFSTTAGVENCKYVYGGGLNLKDSYDVDYGGDMAELLYETMGITSCQNVQFSAGGRGSKNIRYSDWVHNSSDCFGCVSLNHKRYCILNRQYSRHEYETLVQKIRRHMDDMPYVDKKGRVYRYGEFFPTELSAYAYNETVAFKWYPKTKNEVLKEGWRWQEHPARDYKVTLPAEALPDHIRDAKDSLLRETIGCLHASPRSGGCNEQCATAFRLTAEELAFYRAENIALPRLCPNSRHAKRLEWRNSDRLFRRQCMCGNQNTYSNTSLHAHGKERCPSEFETTFPPEQHDIVYCEACYRQEFL